MRTCQQLFLTMGHKAGSKNIWIDGKIHADFKKKILEEGWTWGLTKKLESVLAAYIAGELAAKELRVHQASRPAQDSHEGKDIEKQRRHGEPRIGYWKTYLQKRSNT